METATTALPSGLSMDELLDWRPELGVLTVCVGVDPADRGEGWLIDLRNQLNSAVEGSDDGHDRGRALRATAQRVLDRFEEEELPSGRCQIGFCEAAERRARDVWTAAQMDGFRTRASYADRPRLTPVLKLLDEGAAIGAVAVSSERVLLYEWQLGALDLVHDWEAEMYIPDWRERKAQKPANLASTQGPSSSGRDQYDQRLEHNRARFLKEAGRLIAHETRERDWRRLIAFGDPAHVRELDEGVEEKALDLELADGANVISEDDRRKLLERVNAAVREGNRRRDLSLIERAVEGAQTPGGHGALGLVDIQRALNEARVEHLIYDADPGDQELVEAEDEMVERALRTSAKLTPVEDETAEKLGEHDGVAAILRYQY